MPLTPSIKSRIPRPSLKLPRLILPRIITGLVVIPSLFTASITLAKKLGSIVSSFSQSLSPLQNTLKKLTSVGGIKNVSGKGVTSFITSSLKSASGLISTQVTSLVNGALASATAAVGSVKNITQVLLSQFNQTKSALSKQSTNVKATVTSQIDVDLETGVLSKELSVVSTTIAKTVETEFKTLTNKEQKDILENEQIKSVFVDKITEKAISNTGEVIAANLDSNTGFPNQVSAMIKLQLLT